MKIPLSIGITGGIGSGKSTVCNVFKILGIPVFEADTVGKKLLDTNAKVKSEIIHHFGEAVYTPEGAVNRKKLAEIIFNDEIQLEKINGIIHPAVKNEYNNWLKKQRSAYVIHEAAILFESGFYKMMDFTILVTAPEKDRIKWVTKRDGTSEKQVRERMVRQWPDEKKQKLATFVLHNNNQQLIIPELLKIDKNLRTNGKIW
ncbi:MAG TPA: dephospho-CoA kinase [Prolixibacteraceae bacterium]|nr:dephospho-CoA kinase [Prolixibacteraceae bacterium]